MSISPHASEYAAGRATTSGTVRISRVRGAIRVRQCMNDDGGAIGIEDAQIPCRYRDTAGHVRHRPGAIGPDLEIDQVAGVIGMVGGHRQVVSERTEVHVTAGRGTSRGTGADFVNMHGMLP